MLRWLRGEVQVSACRRVGIGWAEGSRGAVWFTAGVLLAALVGGCTEEDPAPSAPNPTPTALVVGAATPAATPNAPVRLGEVFWARSVDPETGEPRAVVEEFPVETETIYAVAPVRSAPAGSIVSATWALNGTPIQGTTGQVRIEEAASGGWVEFHLSWTGEGVWPQGTLSVTLTANGRPAGEASVTVARPQAD